MNDAAGVRVVDGAGDYLHPLGGSRWRKRTGREPVRVSPETIGVLTVARQASDWTGGKFDVTFGALSGLWKFDQDQDDKIPSPAAIAARLPDVDYASLDVDAARGELVAKGPDEAQLDEHGVGHDQHSPESELADHPAEP